MIYDKLINAKQYLNIYENLEKGFEFLKNSDLKNMPDGKYNISGEKVFANVQTLTTKPLDEAKWEVHRKYIDIQYVISGQEKMGYGSLDDFDKVVVSYDNDKDVEFLEGKNVNYVNVQNGAFTVFFPNDVHAPMLSVEKNEKIKKVIVKIEI